ncbi:MAG: class I SAM-dependent methyltransferase [Actinomycetota bacterium]|nr:class I SAM-dependent methyltransferase [Actinomycetota bacterium]
MSCTDSPYYRSDLALVHHRGFAFHADASAAGILALLAPVRNREGLVVELGCGSGHLTRHLVHAGHRVLATDASPAMLELARRMIPDVENIRQLVLPDDPMPSVNAIVSVGHALNYLPDETSIERALVAIANALRPGGILAIDLCDLRWAEVRRDQPDLGKVGDGWAVITAFSVPAENRYVRDITTFVRNEDGSWRRAHERHENILIDSSAVPRLLSQVGIEALVYPTFGSYVLPQGLVAIIGQRPP